MRIIPRNPPLTGEDPDVNQNANLHQKKEDNGPGEELGKFSRLIPILLRLLLTPPVLKPEEPCDTEAWLVINHQTTF